MKISEKKALLLVGRLALAIGLAVCGFILVMVLKLQDYSNYEGGVGFLLRVAEV